MRTERAVRSIGIGANALASSIVLVCRKREANAETISRRDFQRQLREEMPEALETMIGGTTGRSPIAPVDLAQAAIGPGMAIFSKYAAVLNQDGTPMRVHDALILINREIIEFLTPDAGNFDSDTLFGNNWFEEFGWSAGPFGSANTLAQVKGTSVGGVEAAGVVESGGGKVRLLRWAEYPDGWDPKADDRTPVWEAAHHMIRALNRKGETEAGALLARMPERGEAIRQLAYHLYTDCVPSVGKLLSRRSRGRRQRHRAGSDCKVSAAGAIQTARRAGRSRSRIEAACTRVSEDCRVAGDWAASAIEGNRSRSFQVLIDGVRGLIKS